MMFDICIVAYMYENNTKLLLVIIVQVKCFDYNDDNDGNDGAATVGDDNDRLITIH